MKGKIPTKECPAYDIKQSAGEALILEILGIWSTIFLRLLSGPFRSGELASDRVLSMGQKEQNLCKQMTTAKL